jgi:hypothetical protein
VTMVIRRKTGDGGGSPVTGDGHTAHGWMGGLPGARNRQELARGRKNDDGRSMASCAGTEEKMGESMGPSATHI